MLLRLRVILWTCAILYSKRGAKCNSTTDATRKTFHHSDDVIDEVNWSKIAQALAAVCPGTDFCGNATEPNDTSTVKKNACCLGCSCELSCHEKKNCCYGYQGFNGQGDMYTCLKPIISYHDKFLGKDFASYRFVTREPIGGCKFEKGNHKTTAKNNLDADIAPWGDFLPVFSKSLRVHFKNEMYAKCHGADDFEQWRVFLSYIGPTEDVSRAFSSFYSTFQEKDVDLIFEPPSVESQDPRYLCIMEISNCSSDWEDRFHIPSNVKLDRQTIVEACEKGPRALYLVNNKLAFRNPFCAICKNHAGKTADRLRCAFENQGIKSIPSDFLILFRQDFISSRKTEQIDNHAECYRSRHALNDTGCVPLRCPLLQYRSSSGKCTNPADVAKLGCFHLYVNLSTVDNVNKDVFSNLSEERIIDLFQQFTPWQGCWQTVFVSLRVNTSATEFLISMICNAGPIDIRQFTRAVLRNLDKTWTVALDKKVVFTQSLIKDGTKAARKTGTRVSTFIPRWSHPADPTFMDRALPMWESKYINRNRDTLKLGCIIISKMFFCDQIQLQPEEYDMLSQYALLFLKRSNKFLFPNEYSLYEDNSGNQQVLVCLEDSDYVRVGPINTGRKVRLESLVFVNLPALAMLAGQI